MSKFEHAEYVVAACSAYVLLCQSCRTSRGVYRAKFCATAFLYTDFVQRRFCIPRSVTYTFGHAHYV